MSRGKALEQAKDKLLREYINDLNRKRDIDPVEEALERALEDTTPEHGGRPWKTRKVEAPESEWRE